MKQLDRFSIKRLGGMIALSLTESKRRMIMQIIVMTGILLTLNLFMGFSNLNSYNHYYFEYGGGYGENGDPQWSFLLPFYFMSFIGFGAISASMMMEWMKTRGMRLNTLMTPATQLEKYLSRWLIYTIGFIVVFNVFFFAVDCIRVAVLPYFIDNTTGERIPETHNLMFAFIRYLKGKDEAFNSDTICQTAALSCAAYFAIQSFFVLGSCAWPKNSFLKTAACLIVCGGSTITIIVWLCESLFDGSMYYYPLENNIQKPYLFTIAFSVLALFNWTLGYFRFRESEIIQRW